jgi:SAM-dependent methyltransferase
MKKVLADNNFNYYLPLSKVRKIDKWLVEKYSIDCLVHIHEFYASRGNGASIEEIKKVNRLINRYKKYFDTEKTELKSKVALELTDIYASESWSSWWHSTRRAWLIDSLTICDSIISKITKNKDYYHVIDIGCNVGILANYLVEHHPINVTGIDISSVSISEANRHKKSDNVIFLQTSLDQIKLENQIDMAIAVDFVQPNETNFFSMMEKVGKLIKQNGHLIVIGNFINAGNIDDFFRSIGFTCLNAQLTGGYQQGHASDFEVDWAAKAALHFKKNTKLKPVQLPISGVMTDFATYANAGEFPERELNRSYFLPRVSRKLTDLN